MNRSTADLECDFLYYFRILDEFDCYEIYRIPEGFDEFPTLTGYTLQAIALVGQELERRYGKNN